MYHKVIVMEIKKDYMIVMDDEGQVMKVQPKQDLVVGDKIYVLEEDIIKDKANKPLFSITPLAKQMVGLLAVCLLFVSIWQMNNIDAYAMIRVGGNQNVQLEVDKEGKIKQATSHDGSYDNIELQMMRGKYLEDIELEDVEVVEIDVYDQDDDEFTKDIQAIFGKDVKYVVDKDDVDEDDQKVDEDIIQQEVIETTKPSKVEDKDSDSSEKEEVIDEKKNEEINEEVAKDDEALEDEEESKEEVSEEEISEESADDKTDKKDS